MVRWWLAIATVVLAMTGASCRHAAVAVDDGRQDGDRDGLDDGLEASLAITHMPALHEFASDGDLDRCPQPRPRPVLYRARPRPTIAGVDRDAVAITYVLLYAEDCGALGHAGDHEAFTIFLHRDPDRWRAVAALAIAHQGTSAEQRSIGPGSEIWVSRNKHANFAVFAACGDSDLAGDVCAEAGPAPSAFAYLNVGEPWAPLSNDVGDVNELFRGHRIWNHERFLDAGDLTAQLFLGTPVSVPPVVEWEAEGSDAPALAANR